MHGRKLVIHCKCCPLHEAMLTDQQVLLGARPFHKQSVLLPHELVSSLFVQPHIFHPLLTGEPGRLQWYWSQNADLMNCFDGLDPWLTKMWGPKSYSTMLQDGCTAYRLFRSPKDPATTIPLRIYGDGAEAQQHFEIMSLLPLMSISKSALFQQKRMHSFGSLSDYFGSLKIGDMLRHIGLTAASLLPKHFENAKLVEATDPAGAGMVF